MATVDRRRLPGPERSAPPIYAPLDPTASSSRIFPPSHPEDVARGPNEIRPIYLKTELISQANGSAYIESGSVKIACAVYGPRPKPPPYSPEGTLNLEVKFAPFASYPRRAPLRDTEPPHLTHSLTQALLPAVQLHLLPKSSLDIYLLVLEAESPGTEAVLAAGLTVASAAVADAGIDMGGLAVGVSGALPQGKGAQAVVDPNSQTTREAAGVATVGVLPALGLISDVWMTGEMEVAELVKVLDSCVKASADVHAVLGQGLIAGATERAQASGGAGSAQSA